MDFCFITVCAHRLLQSRSEMRITMEDFFTQDTIQLAECGRQDCSDMHSYGPGMRSIYILHYIIKGSGYIRYNGKTWHAVKGQCFLLFPYTMVSYYPDPEDPWEYAWVDFIGENASAYLADSCFTKEQPLCPFLEASRILPYFEKIRTLDWVSRNKQEANGLLLALLGLLKDTFPGKTASEENSRAARLSSALLLMKSNYRCADFTIEALCGMVHINRTSLYRLFKEQLCLSPKDWLTSYRLKQAGKMLSLGTSVKNTAYSCGFSDPLYFSRAFKKTFGIAPGAFRSSLIPAEKSQQLMGKERGSGQKA